MRPKVYAVKTAKLNIILPEDIKRLGFELAKKAGLSVSQLISRLINEAGEKKDRIRLPP
jgi:hypothetical protein